MSISLAIIIVMLLYLIDKHDLWKPMLRWMVRLSIASVVLVGLAWGGITFYDKHQIAATRVAHEKAVKACQARFQAEVIIPDDVLLPMQAFEDNPNTQPPKDDVTRMLPCKSRPGKMTLPDGTEIEIGEGDKAYCSIASKVRNGSEANQNRSHTNTGTTNVQLYNGDGFSMTVPVGTSVKVKHEKQEMTGQQVTKSEYSFWIGTKEEGVLYTIAFADYSGRAEGTLEEANKSFTKAFDPGYHMTNSTSHLGNLPAECAEINGTNEGHPAISKDCAAYSTDHKRVWIAVAVAMEHPPASLAQTADAFMDSIQIK